MLQCCIEEEDDSYSDRLYIRQYMKDGCEVKDVEYFEGRNEEKLGIVSSLCICLPAIQRGNDSVVDQSCTPPVYIAIMPIQSRIHPSHLPWVGCTNIALIITDRKTP